MGTAMIVVILIVICVCAARSYWKRLSGGCCGAGGDTEKKIRVRDKNPAHYPYCIVIRVEGMICGNCKRRVENALNMQEGVWAEVNLGDHSARIYMKQQVPEQELRCLIARAGYRILEIKEAV